MIFTSAIFVVFFLVFFTLYWFVFNRSLKLQNLLLLSASYFFYGYASVKFLSLLIAISFLNFILGIYIEKVETPRIKSILLTIGLIQGLGGLFLFKYFDFFILSLDQMFKHFNINVSLNILNLAAPIGISFFTFKTISYLLDISKGKIKASKDWISFFIYVAFFPTILSGPIDKAKSFIPQLENKRTFNEKNASNALRQILWGLFKKVVIADNCAIITDHCYSSYAELPASSLLMCAILYSFQLYTDFSGYSDMAIGISRLLGFNVTKNFDYPFFSQNVADYWRKWHMSLTMWLTEYVFTPLSIAFRNWGNFGLILAIIINLTLCGIWHGANWTYVLFGAVHGCFFIPLILNGTMNKKRKQSTSDIPSIKELFNIIKTFLLVTTVFVIFRSPSVSIAFDFYKHIFSTTLFSKPTMDFGITMLSFFFIAIMILIEWKGRRSQFGLELLAIKSPRPVRWSIYTVLIVLILIFGADAQQFIYINF